MYGSRSKIPSKNLVRQRCAEGFNSGVNGLISVNLVAFVLYVQKMFNCLHRKDLLLLFLDFMRIFMDFIANRLSLIPSTNLHRNSLPTIEHFE
jgi:hypothetical protein